MPVGFPTSLEAFLSFSFVRFGHKAVVEVSPGSPWLASPLLIGRLSGLFHFVLHGGYSLPPGSLLTLGYTCSCCRPPGGPLGPGYLRGCGGCPEGRQFPGSPMRRYLLICQLGPYLRAIAMELFAGRFPVLKLSFVGRFPDLVSSFAGRF